MLNIDVKFSGDTKERIEALINGFDKKRGVLMGKIAKRMEVDLRNKFLSNGGRSFWQDAASQHIQVEHRHKSFGSGKQTWGCAAILRRNGAPKEGTQPCNTHAGGIPRQEPARAYRQAAVCVRAA